MERVPLAGPGPPEDGGPAPGTAVKRRRVTESLAPAGELQPGRSQAARGPFSGRRTWTLGDVGRVSGTRPSVSGARTLSFMLQAA